jgi:hypothetical protein
MNVPLPIQREPSAAVIASEHCARQG